jgi:DNA adenine methylase
MSITVAYAGLVNIKFRLAEVRTEKLWFNFTPDRVYWASYAGRNFTDRQRIKRKAANWGKRYRALPRAERLAVPAAMLVVGAEGD